KTTAMGVILELTETQQTYLDNLMARYCAAVRWSFKRLLEGKGIQDIRKSVQVKFNLNSRQANDAVYDAQNTIKSQHELVKFLAYAERRALREGVPVFKVKPAFTSVIGILKYQHQYGLSSHQAAALVIARRGLGHVSERVPKLLVDRFIKAKEGFSKINNWQQWSSIKKSVLKNLKKKGVNSLVSWQVHRKELLGIG
ncbi:MAG: hypothetical protein ACOY3U_13550, partial [Bacillota bacterium]